MFSSDDDLAAFNMALELSRDHSNARASQPLDWWTRLSSAALQIASICREIHSAVTGPKVRHSSTIDEKRVLAIWDQLEKAWLDLDTLRETHTVSIPIVHDEDVARYCDGWQFVIFECRKSIAFFLLRTSTHNWP
jgi:hypothetical protein